MDAEDVDGVEPVDGPYAGVPIDVLEADFLQLKAHLAAGECRLLLMLVEIEKRGSWRNGWRSVAHWLSTVAGIDASTAAAQVRVAERLQRLPVVTEAFANGALTYSQTRAITRALANGADPDREKDLVEVAAHATAAQLEVICRTMAGRSDDDADVAEQALAFHITRRVGGGRITIDLPEVDLERFLAAVDRRVHAEPAPEQDVPLEPLHRRRALAAVDLAVAACGEPDDCPAVNVIIPLADVEAHHAGMLGDRPVAAAVIDRLVCTGTMRAVVVDEAGKPVMTGSRVRNGTVRQRAAVDARDGGRCQCCGSRWRVERHHVLLWTATKLTLVELLVLLCRRCHHDHHQGRFTITVDEADGGRFRFWTSDGKPLHQHADVTGTADGLLAANDAAGVVIDPDKVRTKWTGDRMDHTAIPGPHSAPIPATPAGTVVDEVWDPADDDWWVETGPVNDDDEWAQAWARDALTRHGHDAERVPRDASDGDDRVPRDASGDS
jgi:hypothetical protein